MKVILLILLVLGLTQCERVDGFGSALATNTSCTTDCCKSLPSRSPMTYYFYQNTGRFHGGSGEYAVNTKTYSGQGKGYLNPDYQCVSNTGPLPASTYKLGYCVNYMHQTVERPCAFYLEPQKPADMCGRSAFFVHGCQCCTPQDDTQPPAAGCSAGCIVMNYANRKKLRVGDTLIVQHYEPKGMFDDVPLTN